MLSVLQQLSSQPWGRGSQDPAPDSSDASADPHHWPRAGSPRLNQNAGRRPQPSQVCPGLLGEAEEMLYTPHSPEPGVRHRPRGSPRTRLTANHAHDWVLVQDAAALPHLDVPQRPRMATQHPSPAIHLSPGLPGHPRQDLEAGRWTLSLRPTEPKKCVYCSSWLILLRGVCDTCAQFSAGSRKATTLTRRKPASGPPWERDWLGEARVTCKAQARGVCTGSESPQLTLLGRSASARSYLQVCRVLVGP